jgi:transcriptional regulator with XRE-family HTH domain
MSQNAQFQSVSEMVEATSGSKEFVDDVQRHISERQFVKHLIALRVKKGMTQKEMADAMGCTQSTVSRLENGKDSGIRLGDLEKYTRALGHQPRVVVAPENETAVDEIKYHASRIRRLLTRLVELAEQDEQIADGISQFVCFETPLNLLKIVVDTASRLPPEALDRLPGLIIEDDYTMSEDPVNDPLQPSELQPS